MSQDEADAEDVVPDPTLLIDLASVRMPFGRYAGRLLIDLPGPYVAWFQERGLPNGRLGQLLAVLYEVKANGLEHLVRPLGRTSAPGRPSK